MVLPKLNNKATNLFGNFINLSPEKDEKCEECIRYVDNRQRNKKYFVDNKEAYEKYNYKSPKLILQDEPIKKSPKTKKNSIISDNNPDNKAFLNQSNLLFIMQLILQV